LTPVPVRSTTSRDASSSRKAYYLRQILDKLPDRNAWDDVQIALLTGQ
jgi:hypothetical protein